MVLGSDHSMTSHEPTPRLRNCEVGQTVTLKGAFAVGDALVVSAIRSDGYYELHRFGKLMHTAAGSHEVEPWQL